MVYKGEGSYVYLKAETVFGHAAAAIGSSGHIPINPIVNLSQLPEPRYKEEAIRTIDSETATIIYTSLMEKGEATLELIFKDIFLMALAFQHKVVDTPWTGTNDDITMDFSAKDHRESFMIHIHIHDSEAAANHIDMTFYGCQIEAYKWRVDPGKLMKEIVTISCINAKEDVQVMVCANAFHDQAWGSGVGGWSNWDSVNAPYHASEITPKVGGVAISSLNLLWFEMGFEYPKITPHTTDSMIALNINYDGVPIYFLEVHGTMENDDDLIEIRKTFANKSTNQTIQVTFGDATKYMQFTNGYLFEVDKVKLVPASEALEHKVRYEGGVGTVLSVALRYSIAQDPDAMITD